MARGDGRCADDKNALDPTERQKREAELQERLLDIERQEAALVWRGVGTEPAGGIQSRLFTASYLRTPVDHGSSGRGDGGRRPAIPGICGWMSLGVGRRQGNEHDQKNGHRPGVEVP